jgi:hypothetical protein
MCLNQRLCSNKKKSEKIFGVLFGGPEHERQSGCRPNRTFWWNKEFLFGGPEHERHLFGGPEHERQSGCRPNRTFGWNKEHFWKFPTTCLRP